MCELGIIRADDNLELLGGWLVEKMGKNPPHSATMGRLRRLLEPFVTAGRLLRIQEPISLSISEPEPDVAIVRGADEAVFSRRHPAANEVLLVVEVADSSIERDQKTKKFIYAEAGIPFYWIVNLNDRRLEVYGDPSGPIAEPDYRRSESLELSAEVPLVLDGREVARLSVGQFFV